MNRKKLISLVLSCLMILETPFVSQAASFSTEASQNSLESISSQYEKTDVLSIKSLDDQSYQTTTEDFSTQRTLQGTSNQTDKPQIPAQGDSSQNELLVKLNYSTYKLTLPSAATLQLSSSITKADSTSITSDEPFQINWTSDQPDIASVSKQGLVTAHKAGSAVITVTAKLQTKDGIYSGSASCTITIEKNNISLNKRKLTMYTSETKQLKAKGVSDKIVTWKSSKPKIASVNSSGTIKPKKTGQTTITATANGVSASCKVIVKNPSLQLKSSAIVYLDNSITLHAAAVPKNSISWKSSNSKIATVTQTGKIIPKRTGQTTVTASCNGLKKACKITIKKPSVDLNKNTVTFFAENNYTLKAKAHPNSQLSYRSSDPKVATVDKHGRIKGLKKGTVTITASVPGAKESCKVTVLENNYKLSRSSQTLMKGHSATIYLHHASDSVSFELSDKSVAKLSASGNSCKVTARKAGKTTLNAYYKVYENNQWVTCKRSCTIRVIGSGITQQQAAVAIKATKKLSLKNVKKSGVHITGTVWTSSDPAIASVNRKNGAVTGKKMGAVKITATVSYSDGTSAVYPTSVKVSAPKTKYAYTVLSLGRSKKVSLTGLTPYSTVKWSTDKSSLVSVNSNGTVTAGQISGKTTVNVTVDGKTIKHTIYVTNPSLRRTDATLTPKKKTRITLSGVSSHSKITYRSRKTSVATVNKSGVVTGRGHGNTEIIVTADGNTFIFRVSVFSKRALDACNTGYNIINSSTYSQARRMSPGFYDCSSLVFRSYGCDAGLLGGTPSWAPTAASMAQHLESTGKVLSYHGLSSAKLRPGDLIFYRSSSSNGRYKNIYHVSMYYGNGYRLEKPLCYYYPESNIAMIARPIP